MSLDKKSIHIRVHEESYAKLMTMVGVRHGVDGKTTEHAELLLEKRNHRGVAHFQFISKALCTLGINRK